MEIDPSPSAARRAPLSGVPSLSEFGRLLSVAVKHPRDAFIAELTITAQWQKLNFLSAPNLCAAIDEFERFIEVLRDFIETTPVAPPGADTYKVLLQERAKAS